MFEEKYDQQSNFLTIMQVYLKIGATGLGFCTHLNAKEELCIEKLEVKLKTKQNTTTAQH